MVNIEPRLVVEPGGFIAPDAIAALTLAEWIAWLRARTREYDAYTGQRLTGTSDRLGLVRDSLIRSEQDSQERCLDACWALFREFLSLATSAETREELQRIAASLADILDFVASVPPDLVRRGSSLQSSTPRLVAFALGRSNTGAIIDAAHAMLQPRASALRLLNCLSAPLSWNDLFPLVATPPLSSAAATALLVRFPSQGPEILAKSFETFHRAGQKHLFPYLLADITREGIVVEDELPKVLVSAATHLEGPLRASLLTDHELSHFLAPSLVIRHITETQRSLRFSLRDYAPKWNRYALAIWEGIKAVLEDMGLHVLAKEDIVKRPWDDLIKNARRGRSVPLDPIFLTPSRSDSVVVIPYGVLKKFRAVWIGEGRFGMKIRTCSTLAELMQINMKIASMGLTSADEEIGEVEEQNNYELSLIKELSVGEIVSCLIGAWQTREDMLAVLDYGIALDVENEVNERLRNNIEAARHGAPAVYHQDMNYRSPILVGIPAPKEDHAWQRILVGVVERVLYQHFELARADSDAAQALKSVGIEPFGGSAKDLRNAWVPVPNHVVPRVPVPEPEEEQVGYMRQQ